MVWTRAMRTRAEHNEVVSKKSRVTSRKKKGMTYEDLDKVATMIWIFPISEELALDNVNIHQYFCS